jgi:glycosyltransferase involved in cell wall biosynthesis
MESPDKPLRIAIILPGFSRDADDWAIPAIQSLVLEQAKNHEVTVFSLRYPPAGRYDVGGVQHLATGGTHFGLRSLAVIWRTARSIAREGRVQAFDVVHAFWADEAGLTAVVAGARLGLPAIITFGGGELTYLPDLDYGTQGSKIRGWLIRLAMRRAAALTAGSRYQHQLAIRNGAQPEKLRLLPLGVDTERFSPAEMPGPTRPTIIQAASLVPVKDQALLLEVLERLRARIPDICLRLVGSGPLEDQLRQLATRLDLNHHIIWQEAVPHPAMPDQYRQAQLYLQTSRHESQGMAVLEAMACGLPVIGTPVGVLPEITARPATADPDLLAQQAADIFSQAKVLSSLRLQARKTVIESYDLKRSAELFVSLYHSVRKKTAR